MDQAPAPGLPGAVAVHLALDLEAAVIGTDLDLPVGRAGAGATTDAVAVVRESGGTGGSDDAADSGQRGEGGEAAGGGAVQLLLNEEQEFAALKELATIGRPDYLLIEGYKNEPGEKVVLLRDAEDWESLSELDSIQLVIGETESATGISYIQSRLDVEQLDLWLLDWAEREGHNETV